MAAAFENMTIVELTGPSDIVGRFIETLHEQATILDEIETGSEGRVFRVGGVDSIQDLELEGFAGLTVTERGVEPQLLLQMVRFQHEPPPALGQDNEDYNETVLSRVAAEVERLGAQVRGTNNAARGEVPAGASAPTDQGTVVGAVVAAVQLPMLLEGLGIVRVDELGVVRVSPPQPGEWSGPFLR